MKFKNYMQYNKWAVENQDHELVLEMNKLKLDMRKEDYGEQAIDQEIVKTLREKKLMN